MILFPHAKHISNNVEGRSCARRHPVAYEIVHNFSYIFHTFAHKFLRGLTISGAKKKIINKCMENEKKKKNLELHELRKQGSMKI